MLSDLIEAFPLPALMVEQDGRIGPANKGARALIGKSILGRHYITVLRQPNLLDAVEQAVSSGNVSQTKYLTTEARRDITLHATCTRLPAGQILIVFEDRTATEEASQMRRDFVANVSHELKTPLTALMGFIETLGGAAKDDPEARERFLGIMSREAGRMNRLIGDLLSLSRVEAEERLRPTQTVEFVGLVKSALHALEPMARAERIVLQLDLPNAEIRLPGDTDQLRQVVTNLTENAIKYSPPEAGVRVSVVAEENHPKLRQDAAVLTVIDEGEGIDPVHIPRLTERFYRIDIHRSREMGGTGLGLAIVKHIVNRHRGRLQIESRSGEGSQFSVVLPKGMSNSRNAPIDPASPS